MEPLILILFLGLGGLSGLALLWFLLDQRYQRQLNQAKQQIRTEIQAETQTQYQERRDTLKQTQAQLQAQAQALATRSQAVAEREAALEAENQRQRQELAALSPEAARQEILQNWERTLRSTLQQELKNWQDYLQDKKSELAQEILTRSVESLTQTFAQEGHVVQVPLPHAKWRGKLLGRDGRNIQTLQNSTGADFSLEEDPPSVLISCFDAFRRELARQSILQLLGQPGRLYPEQIETVVQTQAEKLQQELPKLGASAAATCQVQDLPPELLKALGQLNYRTSYGQNVLKHSQEVSQLAGQLAQQLGGNEEIARRAGLLHDLGKGLEQANSTSHTERGVDLAHRCGEAPEVLHAMAAHHQEVRPRSLEALLVRLADTLSAARPGARHQPLERHVQRLQDLEALALTFPGVRQAVVLRAGREVRVLVDPDQIAEAELEMLAFQLARKIETELSPPLPVRVNVQREIQASDFAH